MKCKGSERDQCEAGPPLQLKLWKTLYSSAADAEAQDTNTAANMQCSFLTLLNKNTRLQSVFVHNESKNKSVRGTAALGKHSKVKLN